MRVQALTSFTDYFLVCTGTSSTHVQAIADGLERVASSHGFHSQGIEGKGSGRWVLLDFGDVVVHVFTPDQREFYDLEGLWIDAPREPIPGVEPPGHRMAARA
ncbi:ribosome silencing factor [Myxococcota bacterium]|nr:ribosome silencing factor [Myxococcota bacterium]